MKLPPLPNNIGKAVRMHDIRGKRRPCEIIDEIRRPQHDNFKKAIYLQLLKFPDEKRTEIRLAYYIIGQKPSVRGTWRFGQYATIMPKKDFQAIIKEATKKGWLDGR
jgi:hypothetical protein